ncbi:MAG TPA: hypothetical protein VL283_01985 [Candidatus Baltobacteraceae bacterium]|nr:hypothetical protein [Candidatus Baltobacteraceae bacterium]
MRLHALLSLGLLSLFLTACGPRPRESDSVCGEGLTLCGDACVDLAEDAQNCGQCGYECRGPTSNACFDGWCGCVGANHEVADECDAPTVCADEVGKCILPDYGTTEQCDEIDGIPCKDPSKLCLGGWCTRPDCNHVEECNGKDDDCDGHTDALGPIPGPPDPLARACYGGDPATIGVGICRAGEQLCYYGNWTPDGQCPGEVLPSPEEGLLACDGLDNDCDACVDGRIDENGMLVCDMNEPKTTDVIFMIDVSGSMSGVLSAVITASGSFATTYGGASHIRWGIERIAVVEPTLVDVFMPLGGFTAFLNGLSALMIYGGIEPTYDAVYVTATGGYDAALLNGSTAGEVQIYVVFGDEDAQTLTGQTEATVCQAVAARGAILVVFTNPAYYSQWDDCAVLYPLTSDATQMTNQLDDLFDLTCTF